MYIKVNCKSSIQDTWCDNPKVKKSLWGIGARICPIADTLGGTCEFQDKKSTREDYAPPKPIKKKCCFDRDEVEELIRRSYKEISPMYLDEWIKENL